MRRYDDRAQWEHTDEEEALYGLSETGPFDMPPSLRRREDEAFRRETKLRNECDALKEQLRVAVEALAGIDFGRVRDDGYCEACEECDSENPCIHRLAHDTLTRIASLSKPGDPTP